MYLIDTDTLTHLYAGHHRVINALQNLADADVGTTIITKVELLRGRFDFILKASSGVEVLRAQRWLVRTEELLAQIKIATLDDIAISHFDRLRETKGVNKIGRADLLIASIALANNATLVTRNLRHFRQIPNIKVVNWVD